MASKTVKVSMRIDGVPAHEYAAQWGDGGTIDGCRFYNASDQCRRTGRSIPNPEWGPEEWNALAKAARDRAERVATRVRLERDPKWKPENGYRSGWTAADRQNLTDLGDWAEYMAGACVSNRNRW